MPNSSDGWAIVTAAGIGGLMTVAGVVLTMFFNQRQRKTDFEEKLYAEGFRKRIAVYENVLNTLSRMRTNKELPRNISLNDLKVKYAVYTHVLEILEVKLSLFGSPDSVKIIHLLRDQLADALVIPGDPNEDTYARDVRVGFMGYIWKTLLEFTETARTEAPIKIVDEFVHMPGKRIKMVNKHDQTDHGKRKDRHRRNNNN
jgi:hypothetical protein